MNLKHLKFFVELAHTQHMAKAAENLGVSQPSLSYAIHSIEDELGAPLFEKDGRNIKLTNYGRIYLTYVEQSLNDLKQGSEHISELLDVNRGHINIGFTYTLGQDLVPRLVNEFRKDKKNKIRFTFKQDTTAHLVNELINDDLDLVLSSKPHDKLDQLNIYHLVDQEMMVGVPLKNPLARRDSIKLKDLEAYPFINYSDKSGLRPRINQICKSTHFVPKTVIEAVEDHTIVGFVHWGFGVAILPHLPQLSKHSIKLLHIQDNIQQHQLFVLNKTNHFLTPATNRFQEFILKYCRKYYINQNKLI